MRPGHSTNAGQVDTDNTITATSTNTQQQLAYIIDIILLIETKLMYDVVDYSTSSDNLLIMANLLLFFLLGSCSNDKMVDKKQSLMILFK